MSDGPPHRRLQAVVVRVYDVVEKVYGSERLVVAQRVLDTAIARIGDRVLRSRKPQCTEGYGGQYILDVEVPPDSANIGGFHNRLKADVLVNREIPRIILRAMVVGSVIRGGADTSDRAKWVNG